MVINQRVKDEWKKLDNKLNFSQLKFQYLSFLIVVAAIPLTIVLALNTSNFRSKADEGQVLEAQDINDIFSEADETPVELTKPDGPVAEDITVMSAIVKKTTTSRPNIVVIMIDDMNPMDGRMWNYTPNIKKYIIDKGVNFTNAYGETPICCPGRSGLLSGQHTTNHGVYKNDGRLFNPKETIATELQKENYYTFWSGKYLNKTDALSDKTPPGWNHLSISGGGFYGYYLYNDGVKTFKAHADSDYSTDVFGNKAVSYLREAPAGKPIFGILSPYAIHGTSDTITYPVPARRDKDDPKCSNVPDWNPPNYNEADLSDKPAYIRERSLMSDKDGLELRRFCEAMLSVDNMVGKIAVELKSQNRLDNTIFILMADNGMNFGQHRFLLGKNTPFSTQIPLYIAWPQKIGTTPRKVNDTVMNIDLAPTLCAIAGCSMGPYPNGQKKSDGISILPLLLGTANNLKRDAVFENNQNSSTYIPKWFAVRTTPESPLGLWHYIENNTGEKELYDVSGGPCYEWSPGKPGDPCELNNLLRSGGKLTSAQNSIRVKLQARLNELKKEKGYVAHAVVNPTPTSALSITPTSTPTPTLVVSLTPIPSATSQSLTATLTKSLTSTADSYVKSDSATTNFGSSSTLNAKASNPKNIIYLEFGLGTAFQGKTIKKATLRLKTSSAEDAGAGSTNKLEVKTVTGSFTQGSVNYNNRPALGSTVGAKDGAISSSTTFDIDVTSAIAGKSGNISLAIESVGNNSDSVIINSAEASSGKPTLIVEYQ